MSLADIDGSGNPAGKPKGARHRTTVVAEALLDGEAEVITRKVIDLALAGDISALRLCLERLIPPRKDRPVEFDLPQVSTSADAAKAALSILRATAEGSLTPSEAEILSSDVP
jgi:Family of unknown function (DUF5681)